MTIKSNKIYNDLKERFTYGVARNAQALTIITIAFILFTGGMLIVNPSSWWIPVLLWTVVSLAIVFINSAHAVIKITITMIGLLIASIMSLWFGAIVSPYDNNAMLWFLSYWLAFFVCMTYASIKMTGGSKWTAHIASVAVSFFASYLLGFTFLSSIVGSLTVILVYTLVFCMAYVWMKPRVHTADMPTNYVNNTIVDALIDEALSEHKNIRFIEGKNNTGFFHVWDSNKLYNILPVHMSSPLSYTTNKRGTTGIGYQGKSINSWLLNNIFTVNPTFISRGAQGMLVVVDIMNRNGSDVEIIDVSVPDTNYVIPVLLIPGNSIAQGKSSIIHTINDYSEYNVFNVNSKQALLLEGIGRTKNEASIKIKNKK